jgi:hypothetical protein
VKSLRLGCQPIHIGWRLYDSNVTDFWCMSIASNQFSLFKCVDQIEKYKTTKTVAQKINPNINGLFNNFLSIDFTALVLFTRNCSMESDKCTDCACLLFFFTGIHGCTMFDRKLSGLCFAGFTDRVVFW